MIIIENKKNCCGCCACLNVCPKSCIKMRTDEEGFLYPEIDSIKCINCGLCEKVCPFLVELNPRLPLTTYAAINPNVEERLSSSSGGIFTLLMRDTLKNGGVVFGASFDNNWHVCHIAIERVDDICKLQGSKYVQSTIGNCYKEAQEYLRQGREVLFSGTTCQIAGLHSFLRKEYSNLTTVDVVCHGVPSPKVWESYLSTLRRPKGAIFGENTVLSSLNETPSIEGISFRDKQKGWRKYGFVVRYSVDQREARKFGFSSVKSRKGRWESLEENLFMKGFLRNLYLRPSCYACKVRSGRCGSDLTLGDFWGIWNIRPEIDDNKGTSLILVNTRKGSEMLMRTSSKLYQVSYDEAVKYNHCIEHSVAEPEQRSVFWGKFLTNNSIQVVKDVIDSTKKTLIKRILNKIERTVIMTLKKF